MSPSTDEILTLLKSCSLEQRRQIYRVLEREFPIHPLERELNVRAEVILQAISRAGGLTLRMIRGVIAEAAFEIEVLNKLVGWQDTTPDGDLPYDFQIDDGNGPVRIQVKLQRSKDGQPARANQGYARFSPDMYLIEPQKTRRGERSGESTRSYRFDEFDILAASMQPSTNDWSSFMYTITRWLLPETKDDSRILKFQPIPFGPNQDWTDDLKTSIKWFRSDIHKRISITPKAQRAECRPIGRHSIMIQSQCQVATECSGWQGWNDSEKN